MLVIVPTRGHFPYARRAVETLLAGTPEADALVVDDASPDWRESEWAALAQTWPNRLGWFRFEKQGGLTRSWNYGLESAQRFAHEWAVCGNSDLVFPRGWWLPLQRALGEKWDLVGPVSNAPGRTSRGEQSVWKWLPSYVPSDDVRQVQMTADRLAVAHPGKVIPCNVNGFCFAASTSSWWSGAFDTKHVFDPRHALTGNEDELQRRWSHRRRGVVLASFVFHYRSVTRGPAFRCKGWYRPSIPLE